MKEVPRAQGAEHGLSAKDSEADLDGAGLRASNHEAPESAPDMATPTPAEEAAAALDAPSSRRRRSSQSLRRKIEKSRRVILVQRIAMIAIASALIIGSALTANSMRSSSQREIALRRQLIEVERQQAADQATISALEGQVGELVAGRIPGLAPLTFDRVLRLEHEYARSITFTRIRVDHVEQFEFQLVMENNRSPLIEPKLDVVLFDRLGFELSRQHIGQDIEMGVDGFEGLRRGEVRSHAAVFAIPESDRPAYFLVR